MSRIALALLVLASVLGAAWVFGLTPVGLAPAAADEETVDPEVLLQQAAELHRQGQCDGAQSLLQPMMDMQGAPGSRARWLAGLYAHACERPQLAEPLLEGAEGADAGLEDWRLWVLADSALANRRQEAALTALTRLLARHPDSPLRPRAMHRAATLAWESGQDERTAHLLAMARYEELAGEPGVELEVLAWEFAGAKGDVEGRRETARQLLARYPFKAAELRVVELFRPSSGRLVWIDILPPGMLARRARSLIDAGLPGSALEALNEIPDAERTFDWHLLAAEALVADHRGTEALRLLATAEARSPAARVHLEWWRGLAAIDMATTRTGRANLDAAGRETMRRAGREHLFAVAREDADRELSLAALRRLYADLADAGEFERSVETLSQLRRLDPTDTTGAQHLWALGWREYTARNWTGAIGYWAELIPLYGGSPHARAGRYWTARAYEWLGDRGHAVEAYRQLLAADTADFYHKQALARLGDAPREGGESFEPPTDPWPEDPVLVRARRLADMALPHLALSEIEAVMDASEPRAAKALRARLLYQLGEYRPAIHTLSQVFPALGTAQQAGVPLEARQIYYPLAYQETVARHAGDRGLPPELVLAMIRQESAFDAAALSRSGARGLMQVMPATGSELARRLGLSFSLTHLDDPDYSVRLGTTYFRQVLDMFGGNEELALAGYNNGPFRIKRLWQEAGPRPELDHFLETLAWDETRSYVKRILIHKDSYRQLYREPG